MIFEKYPYKTKIKALGLLFIMLSYTAYKRSFSSLISVRNENKELNEKLSKINSKNSDINTLNYELAALDKIIGGEVNDKEEIQQNIMAFFSRYSKNISIYNLDPIHEFENENYIVYTNQLDVTGGINDLLRLSYDFEKEFTSSKLISASFYTQKTNNKTDVLHLKMIFQNYENNKQ